MLHIGLTSFPLYLYKILFAIHSKHSSFWPSADVNPLSNDQMHAKFGFSVCTIQSLCLAYYTMPPAVLVKIFRIEVLEREKEE